MKLSESRQQSKNIIITACVFLTGLLCWGVRQCIANLQVLQTAVSNVLEPECRHNLA